MELTLIEWIQILLLGSGALLLGGTAVTGLLDRRARKRALQRRVICRLCLHAFETQSGGSYLACPRCGALTEKGRCRRLG